MEKNKAMLAGNRAYQLFLAVIAPLTVLLIWALGSNLGLIRASILPSPQRVLSTLISLCTSGQMAEDLSISMLRVLRGFGLGAVCGIIIGSLMGFSKTAQLEQNLALLEKGPLSQDLLDACDLVWKKRSGGTVFPYFIPAKGAVGVSSSGTLK